MSSDAPAHRVIEIDHANVQLIPQLLYRVFGYTYTAVSLYSEAGVRAALDEGSHFFVAVDDAGRPAGLLALRFTQPSRALAEVGVLAVDPVLSSAARGRVLRLLGQALSARSYELIEDGLRGLMSTEVTVHTLAQRLVMHFGFVTTGIYLGLAPAWAERLRNPPDERSRSRANGSASRLRNRRTETVSALPFDKMIAPYAVALPARFDALLRTIYAGLQMPVSFEPGADPHGPSTVVEDLDLLRSRAVVRFSRVGDDAPAVALERVEHYRRGQIELIHVALPLTHVRVDDTVNALTAAGFSFGALVPLYAGDDALVLQFLNGVPVDITDADLHSPIAKLILRDIMQPGAAVLR